MENIFKKLYAVDCSAHTESKAGFSYLSWPFAVAQIRANAPDTTWEVIRFDGMPYLKTECGFFVEVAVTVAGITLSQIHPVLDNKNKPISMPNAFHINTSIQRCMVKAMALHGLGLSIYAGEDIPNPDMLGPTYIDIGSVAEINTLIGKTNSILNSFLAYIQAPCVEQIKVGVQHSKALASLNAKLLKVEAAAAAAKAEQAEIEKEATKLDAIKQLSEEPKEEQAESEQEAVIEQPEPTEQVADTTEQPATEQAGFPEPDGGTAVAGEGTQRRRRRT